MTPRPPVRSDGRSAGRTTLVRRRRPHPAAGGRVRVLPAAGRPGRRWEGVRTSWGTRAAPAADKAAEVKAIMAISDRRRVEPPCPDGPDEGPVGNTVISASDGVCTDCLWP